MKFLKYLLVIVLLLVALFLLVGLFYPTEITVKKTKVIEAPKNVVKEQLVNMKEFNNWSPWYSLDTNAEYTFDGTMGKPGSSVSWDGNEQVGTGTMTLKAVEQDSILTEIQFRGEGGSVGQNYYLLEEKDNGVKVTWGFHQTLSYPMHLIPHLIGIEDMLDEHYTEGLRNLNDHCKNMKDQSKNVKVNGYEIQEVEFPSKTYFTAWDTVPFSGISDFYGENFKSIGRALGKAGIAPDGPPCGMFRSWNAEDSTTVMAAAMPISGSTEKDSVNGYSRMDLAPGRAFMIEYHGAYEKSGKAHEAMEKFLDQKKVDKKNILALEEYVTDPGQEPDTSKWVTNIYYVVRKE